MAEALYVVLRHEGIEKPHFDLMFQTAPGSALATWRSDKWPIEKAVTVEKLADHRAAYLTFEGNISGNRGTVRRIEQGISAVEKSGAVWTIRIRSLPDGKKSILELSEQPDGSWRCVVTPAAPDRQTTDPAPRN
jgi:hypothetical protein